MFYNIVININLLNFFYIRKLNISLITKNILAKKNNKKKRKKKIFKKYVIKNDNFFSATKYIYRGITGQTLNGLSKKVNWWNFILNYIHIWTYATKKSSGLPNYFWLITFWQIYFNKIFGYKLSWYFANILKTLEDSPNFIKWWKKFYSEKLLQTLFTTPIRFFYILVNIILFKNIDLLIPLIQVMITEAPLKTHKKHFYHVKGILDMLYRLLSETYKLSGYSLFFKGKLARKGSIRKSTFFFKKGRVSSTNKLLRTNYRKFLVYTETGVVGCCITLFF